MRELKINRINSNDIQTLGCMSVIENNKVIKVFSSLELPDLNNRSKISCIPKGHYIVKIRTSEKFGKHFHITNVPGRDYILIHAGNYHNQILGCVLIGKHFSDLNNDSYLDVVSSKDSLNDLIDLMPPMFNLEIL